MGSLCRALPNHLQDCPAALQDNDDISILPFPSWRKRNRVSSVRECEPVSGINGITTSSYLFFPLPLFAPISIPVFFKISATNGRTVVKAPSGVDSAVLSPPKLTLFKSIEAFLSGSKSRRFSPQLLGSTRCLRKNEELGTSILPHDETDLSPRAEESSFQWLALHSNCGLRLSPENLSVVGVVDIQAVSGSRPPSSGLSKKEALRHPCQEHNLSFIYFTGHSEEFNEPNGQSIYTSSFAASVDNVSRDRAIQHRTSGHKKLQGFLLTIIVRVADNSLRKREMATYPDEKVAELGDHFAVARENIDFAGAATNACLYAGTIKEPGKESYTCMRDSAAGCAMEEMYRLNRSSKESEKKQLPIIPPRAMEARAMRDSSQDRVQIPEDINHDLEAPDTDSGTGVKDFEKPDRRKSGSPPLAGGEIRFAWCQSPRQTRLDAGHIFQEPRQTARDLVEHSSGLWTPGGAPRGKGSAHGLWMGTSAKCADDFHTMHGFFQMGLLTPSIEQDNLVESSVYYQNQLPPSPPASHDGGNIYTMNPILSEKDILEEFHDAFITQVYNYLSLGYPSMARKYDAELSKVSKVSIDELRRDDSNLNANGYVAAPKEPGAVKEGTCARWGALREYVKDWARQQGHFPEDIVRD